MITRQPRPTLSPTRLAACRANIRKAHEANRRNPLSPARAAALRKATEANRQNFRMTPARRAAMTANARKMQAASVEKFRLTDKRRQAIQANLEKAWAAPRPPERYARSRFNDLRHGLYVRTLEETLTRLGENPQEFAELHRLLARAFAPRGEVERKLIRRLAEAVWRRLRLFSAQARWEKDTLMCGLSVLPAPPRLSVLRTRALAYALFGFFTKQGQLLCCEQTLDGAIERRLRALLRKRSGGDPQFKIITRESRRELEEWEEQEAQEETLRRLEEGGPEVERILEETMPDWWVKRYHRLKATGASEESEAEPETPAVPTDEACE